MSLLEVIGILVAHLVILTLAWDAGDAWAYRRGFRQGLADGEADARAQASLQNPPET